MKKRQAIRGRKSRTILGAFTANAKGFHGKCRVAVVDFKSCKGGYSVSFYEYKVSILRDLDSPQQQQLKYVC